MFAGGEFLKSANNKTRFQFIRFNISRLNIIYISKRRFCQPFATAQFLADSTLNILLKIIGIIFRLTERHLQHKETLRSWLKPKCRKTQRNDFGRVYCVDDAPAVNTVTSKSIRHSMLNFVGRIFFSVVHGILLARLWRAVLLRLE